jgi:uncharacterized protein YbaR (Trm112 family)
MAFNKKLLDILACPSCKGKLILHDIKNEDTGENTSENVNESMPKAQELVCRFDRVAYAIEDGIAVLLESERRALSLEELEQVKAHD